MVLVWIVTEVSPRWKNSDRLVMVRTTLQDESPNAAPSAVSAAISTDRMILISCFLFIVKVILIVNYSEELGKVLFSHIGSIPAIRQLVPVERDAYRGELVGHLSPSATGWDMYFSHSEKD